MESMPAPATPVTVGVDTHLELHVAAVIDQAGRLLGTQAFPASTRGYVALVTWAEGFGPVERVGVEGTGTFGAGLGVALLVDLRVEGRWPAVLGDELSPVGGLVVLDGDRALDPARAQVGPVGLGALGLVGQDPVRSGAGPSRTAPRLPPGCPSRGS